MRYSKILRPFVALAAVVAFCVAPTAEARTPRFDVLVLPPLMIDGVEQPNASVFDLNNVGQVTGRAGVTAFRYTPSVGMQAIKIGRGAYGAGRLINDRGDVLGEDFASNRWFLFRDETGLDRLRRGLGGRKLDRLFVSDLNNHGDLVATTISRGKPIPLRYREGEGWRDLSGLDPRFAPGAFGKWINDAGDLIVSVSRQPEPGANPPFARQQTFVLQRGETLVALSDTGRGVNVAGDLNENGEFAGLFIDDDSREQTYIYRPGLGMEEIRAGNFRETVGLRITEDGIVGGIARKEKGFDYLFWVDPAERGKRAVVGRREFKRLARAAGSRAFLTVILERMNDRVEFVGHVRARRPDQLIPFLSSPDRGLHTIQSIVDAAGADLEVEYVIDLNNRGQILVSVLRPDGTATGAILTPRE